MTVEADAGTLAGVLAEIVATVFETMVRLPVADCRERLGPGANVLTASVRLGGRWTGAVLLECPWAEARRFAGRFLSMEPTEPADEIVRDVMGELVNMIGGNLKSVLTEGAHLSCPTVLDGGGDTEAVDRAMRDGLTFQTPEGGFRVMLVTTGGSSRVLGQVL